MSQAGLHAAYHRRVAKVLRNHLPVAERWYGAEIGVWQGALSQHLLDTFWTLHLVCVDPWKRYRQMRPASWDACFCQCRDRLAPHGKRARLVRLTSKEAAESLELKPLDFVHIDANHTYKSVSEDLRLWAPKLRPGGLLMCHDYGHSRYVGVRPAFDEYCEQNNLPYPTTPGMKIAWVRV